MNTLIRSQVGWGRHSGSSQKVRMPPMLPTLISDESRIRALTLNCWYLSSQHHGEHLLRDLPFS